MGSTVILKEFCSDSVSILGGTLPFSLKKKIQKNGSVKGSLFRISHFILGLIFSGDAQTQLDIVLDYLL